MKKRILVIVLAVYFIVFIVFSFFIKRRYILFDDIIFNISGNSFSSMSSYPHSLDDKSVNIFINDTKYDGYIDIDDNLVTYYDDSFNKIDNSLVACFNCNFNATKFEYSENNTLSDEDNKIINKYFSNHFREFSEKIKFIKKVSHDFDNDGQNESLYLLSNLFDNNEFKKHNFKDEINGDYYEVAFIYDNGVYETIFKKDITESNSNIYDLNYFFKMDGSDNKNFYFRVNDYFDTDLYCGSIFSNNDNEYVETMSCQINRGA